MKYTVNNIKENINMKLISKKTTSTSRLYNKKTSGWELIGEVGDLKSIIFEFI